MPKLKLTIDERKDIFLHTTKVENLFINEFLPDSPGDYVKVFLFGLMYAQYDQAMDSETLSMNLGLSEDEIEEAWIYWESKGLVRISTEAMSGGETSKKVIFVSQVEQLYGKALTEPETETEVKAEAEVIIEETPEEIPYYVSIDDEDFDEMFDSKMNDNRLRDTYRKYQEVTGRTISRHETGKIEDAIKVYGIDPDIFDFSIDYCADLEKYSIDYIFKVALRWTEEGCTTIEEVKKLLEKHSLRNSWYTQVFKALGFRRLPAPADREIMDRWFDEMGCSIDEVIDACNASAGIREPNLRYVNKVIENRRLEKGGINTKPTQDRTQPQTATPVSEGGSPVSRKVLTDYYKYLQTEGEADQKRRVNEVIKKVPEMKDALDEENKLNTKMLSIKPGEMGRDERQMLKAERYRLEDHRINLLESNGFPADYMNREYKCDICKDTGYTDDGMVCSCAKKRAEEAFEWIGEKKQSE